MQSPDAGVSPAHIGDTEFPLESPTNAELENFVVSPCGRFESFDYKGNHFEIDWAEIIGDEDEEEIPHEQVMAEMRQYCEELHARRRTGR
jgi:hypothetical protein